jgi:hypothetical protein
VRKSCGVEIKHDNKIMEMSVMVHTDIPENIHKKIITVGKKNYVANFYSYMTQRVYKTICDYISACKFAITLALNVLNEKFVQMIKYQHHNKKKSSILGYPA